MDKKARVILLTITVVLTLFTFVSMCLTRPGHSELAEKVLKAAAERQSQSLVSINEPLETDTAVLSAEEKMASSVAEILKADSEFNGYVKDTAKAIADIELDEWKKSTKAEILSNVEDIMSSYSLDEYIPALEAKISESIDNRFGELSSELDSKLSDNISAAEAYADNSSANAVDSSKAYTDNAIESSAEELKAYADQNAVDVDSIAKEIVSSLGVSDAPEYVDAVKRIVNSAIESAIADSRVYDAASELIEAKHNELMEGFVPAVTESEEAAEPIAEEPVASTETAEEAPAVPAEEHIEEAEEEPAAAPSVPEAPAISAETAVTPITAPSFGEPKRELTQDEYRNERAQRRSEQLALLENWLNNSNK